MRTSAGSRSAVGGTLGRGTSSRPTRYGSGAMRVAALRRTALASIPSPPCFHKAAFGATLDLVSLRCVTVPSSATVTPALPAPLELLCGVAREQLLDVTIKPILELTRASVISVATSAWDLRESLHFSSQPCWATAQNSCTRLNDLFHRVC